MTRLHAEYPRSIKTLASLGSSYYQFAKYKFFNANISLLNYILHFRWHKAHTDQEYPSLFMMDRNKLKSGITGVIEPIVCVI